MNRAEKIKLLRSVQAGEISVEDAFAYKPTVFIGNPDTGSLVGDNGRQYSTQKVETFKHTVFILPDNGRN